MSRKGVLALAFLLIVVAAIGILVLLNNPALNSVYNQTMLPFTTSTAVATAIAQTKTAIAR